MTDMNSCDRQSGGGTRGRSGFVLLTVMGVILFVAMVAGFFLYTARNHTHTVRQWYASDQCLLDAQSALEQVKYEIFQAYLSNAQPSLTWFQTWSTNAIGSSPAYTIPALAPINGSFVTVTIANVTTVTNAGYAEVALVGTASRPAPFAVTRSIKESLRVTAASGGGDVQPFDYAYLLNSAGQLRDNMVVNGDIRINGNYRLNPSSIVNGNRYVSGKLRANSPLWAVQNYWTSAASQSRPTDPTGDSNISWPMGYVPDKTKNKSLPVFTMPSIDNIDALAATVQGRIIQNGADIVVNAYTGPGPDNIPGTADDNCLVLDGSSSPVTILGSVVVKGDLIIRGKVGGQGAIYAGRNVHIVGDLSYVNPPAWPKPDSTPNQTAANNATKDLLILGAKGNIVVGNYTTAIWSNKLWGIMTASANSYSVSASDAEIGYDSDNNPANGYLFDGRYYVNEANGGQRLSGAGTKTMPRKYYESSLANSAFNALCSANNVPSINAALLTNHGIIGELGSSAARGNTVLNGAMACHDELDGFYGLFTINWDIRLSSQSKDWLKVSSGRPGGIAATSTTISWREIH